MIYWKEDSRCDNACAATNMRPGVSYIARGATGRYCEVLWICEDCADKSVMAQAVTIEKAREWANNQPDSWADF